MAQSNAAGSRFEGTALLLAPRMGLVSVLGAVMVVGGVVAPDPVLNAGLLLTGFSLIVLALLVRVIWWSCEAGRRRLRGAVSGFVAKDVSPSFLTDAEGDVIEMNAAARERMGNRAAPTLAAALADMVADPLPVLFRIQGRVQAEGAAREEVATRSGHVQLSAHEVGRGQVLWRLEDVPARQGPRPPDGLSVPMLTVGRNGTVLFMNEACRQLLGGRRTALDRVFNALPLQPGQVNEVEAADGPRQMRVLEVDGSGGRRELFLFPEDSVAEAPGAASGWTFFDELPVPLLKIAPEGEIVLANRPARELLGDPLAPGACFPDLMEGLGRPVQDWLLDAAAGRGLHSPEFMRSIGREHEVFVQVSLNRVSDGGKVYLIAVLNDATELKTLEAQFVQSQKMQAIGQLAGGVAHDFNNLLTAISGHCDLLLLRHDQGDPDYGDLVQINQNANRAASLVGQLLAFSRKQNLRLEVLDLRDTLSDLTHLLNRLVGEKVTLTLVHDPGLRPIRADKRQLEQVLMNLVVNARDAMPEGGEIRIDTESRTLSKPLRRDRAVVPPGDYVAVTVRDEGLGIAPDKLAKIFEPFFTTKRTGEGTGLGLSTAYGIVKQTGGYIFVDSVPAHGTTFTLYFPAHERPEPKPAAAVPALKPASARCREGVVLLVEDEAPVRAFASRALRMRGYTVIEADSAEAALDTLKDDGLSVDVFVTDVIMPGMDGPSWVKQALRSRPDTKVIFVSGYAEESFSDQQSRIPNSVFLPKPFSLNDLTATVQSQLQ